MTGQRIRGLRVASFVDVRHETWPPRVAAWRTDDMVDAFWPCAGTSTPIRRYVNDRQDFCALFSLQGGKPIVVANDFERP
jgi:hypothetical protein